MTKQQRSISSGSQALCTVIYFSINIAIFHSSILVVMGAGFPPKLALFLFLGSIAARAVVFEQTKFIIGAYSEPQYSSLMDASYAQMAAAGFNMVWKSFFC